MVAKATIPATAAPQSLPTERNRAAPGFMNIAILLYPRWARYWSWKRDGLRINYIKIYLQYRSNIFSLIYALANFVFQFDLACKEWKRTLVGTVHNVGVLLSMPLMGYISDKYALLYYKYSLLYTYILLFVFLLKFNKTVSCYNL